MFTEDLLHYLWKFRLYNKNFLQTITQEPIEILSVGSHNKNAGPDFLEAKIRIGDTLWAGNVEIHIKSSDWIRHNHSPDQAYDNVILHVVYEYDQPVFRSNGSEIQTLQLKGRIDDRLINRYQILSQSTKWIPCESQLSSVNQLNVQSWLARLLVERLQGKSEGIHKLLIEYKGSWDDAFYITLARNFGFKTNALPFEMLARSLPQIILAKHKSSNLQIESLVFGQSGFLNNSFADAYPTQLKIEYEFLKNKYNLKNMEQFVWKFMRLRPSNFPVLRLAQFAALIIKSNHLFSRILEIHDVKELKKVFKNLPVNNYWETHYKFDTAAKAFSPQLGNESVYNILINTVSSFLFAYGKFIGNESFVDRALHLLEILPNETNMIIRRFIDIGIQCKTADSSQALIQLKNNYCDEKKCLDCGIGNKILNNHTNDTTHFHVF